MSDQGKLLGQLLVVSVIGYVIYNMFKGRENLENTTASATTTATPATVTTTVTTSVVPVSESSPTANKDTVAPSAQQAPSSTENKTQSPSQQQATLVPQPLPSEGTLQEISLPSSNGVSQIDKIVNGTSQKLTTTDLLPKYEDATAFAKENQVGNLLKEQNFLQAGYHTGINTIVQSNKIPYSDIRSMPPIPKSQVGPWNQSSFEKPVGSGRRFLDIGA